MTGGELAVIMRALGALESKVDGIVSEQATIKGKVETLEDAAIVAATLTGSRRKFYARVAVAIGCICSLSTAGTALVVYITTTTHPGSG